MALSQVGPGIAVAGDWVLRPAIRALWLLSGQPMRGVLLLKRWRMACFTMNLMLASGGYPWTVIRVDDRAAYMAALEKASVEDDLSTFSAFVAGCVRATPSVDEADVPAM